MSEQIKKQLSHLNKQVKELTAIYHHAAIKAGLSDGEFWVFYALLLLDGEYSQQDICDMWSLPKQTIHSVITTLAKKGYVFLETIPGSRNKKIIRLTQDGKNISENTMSGIFQAEQRALARLTEQERQLYLSLLVKYTSLLQEEMQGIPSALEQ